MNAKSFANLMVLMLVATMALEASAAAETQTVWCKVRCGLDCLGVPDEPICYSLCLKGCGAASKVETLEGQCNLGCVVSKCFELRPESKKVKGCVNSCVEGCKKFEVLSRPLKSLEDRILQLK